MSWILPFSVLASVALGLFSPVLYRLFRGQLGRVLALWPAALFVYFVTLAPRVADGEIFRAVSRWFSFPGHWFGGTAVDINFGFTLDGLALLFVLLITGVGALVLFYAGSYLGRDEDHGAFFAYLMLFIGAMLGVVMADNLLLMYLFWEATSITSFLLIGFWSYRDESRAGALKALLVTGSGGLALLAGIVLMVVVTGSADLATILAGGEALRASSLYPAALVLVLLGAFTKSAQVPFHLWLPNAMEAPTPVSAYLHSAAMVKAGIYLIARMTGILGGTALWTLIVSIVGITSLVLGAYLALRQTDLKAILAFSTISQLGLIVALFGWGTTEAVAAAVFHVLNHSVFKAALFMMVGIVDHQTGSRDIRLLKGLGAFMPITAGIALVASLALAGVPPLNGFVSKEMFFAASLKTDAVLAGVPGGAVLTFLFPVLAVVGSILTFIYSLRISHGVFYRQGTHGLKLEKGAQLSEAPRGLWIPPAVLAALAVVFGIAPALVDNAVVASAVRTVLGPVESPPLALWHGFNVPLLMSVAVMAIGLVGYAGNEGLNRAINVLPTRPNMNALYDWSLDALTNVSEFVEGRMLTGFTRDYIAYMLGFFLVLLAVTMLAVGPFPLQVDFPPQGSLEWTEFLIALLMAIVALCIPFFRSRVASIIALGAIGTSLVIMWTLFRAPDLALTTLVVEPVTLLLFLLVFIYLPRMRKDVFKPAARWLNVVVAGGAGLATTLLLLGVRGLRTDRPVADWYIANSLPEAHGANVVNVILVDFRGFDTMFEITVLALAGLGVYILSNLRFKGGVK